jgi:uncharacterized protein (TIGR03086 family)
VPLDDFDRAAATVTGIISAVRPSQLGLPTACPGWTVRAVIDHLIQGNLKTVSWTEDGGAIPDGDHVGADALGAFERSVRAVRAVLSEPGLFERTVPTPIGTVPGIMLVPMRKNEYLAHGWDIADATCQPTDFAPDLAEQALEHWRARIGDAPRQPGGPFGPARPVPEGAGAADRLAAFLGHESVHARQQGS